MDHQNFTENLIVSALAIVFVLLCWVALQATCAVVAKVEPHKAPAPAVEILRNEQ